LAGPDGPGLTGQAPGGEEDEAQGQSLRLERHDADKYSEDQDCTFRIQDYVGLYSDNYDYFGWPLVGVLQTKLP
jgi:hypothetical protein